MVTGPEWARWAFSLLFAVIAATSAAQLVRESTGRTAFCGERAVTVDHLLMALGMIVMFLPVATPVPPTAWAVVFAGQAGWALWRLVHAPSPRRFAGGALLGDHLVVHLLAASTMASMFATMPSDGLSGSSAAHAGHLGAAGPVSTTVTWLAAAFFLAHVLWCGVQLAAPSAPRERRLPTLLAMGLGMSYMLVTML